MCSRAHFSSIVGFRVISIKDLSHLSLSLFPFLFASLLHGAEGSLYFSLSVVLACQLAGSDARARSTISVPRERETLVLSTIILYDGRLQLVARANKTLRQHRKRNFEKRRHKTNQPSWRKQANKHTRLRSFYYSYSCCSHKSFLSHLPHFNLVHCFFYLSCARAVVVVSLASPQPTYIFHRPNCFILMSSLKHTCVIAVCLVALSY
jgi:hypothetical protein